MHLTQRPSFTDRDLTSMRRGNLYPIMDPTVRPADPELRRKMLGLTEAGSVALISGDETDQPENRRGRGECFDADSWMHTGDLAATDSDGSVCYLGRRGSMIKRPGHREMA